MQYATFWQRFGAYWLDAIILLPLIGFDYWMGEQYRLFAFYFLVPRLVFVLWYNVYLVKRYGGTPGKLLLKMRIARVDGSPVGYREAGLRYSVLLAVSTISSVGILIAILKMSEAEYHSLDLLSRGQRLSQLAPSWYGITVWIQNIWDLSEFIVMLTNDKRRALHDFIAGTVVVRNVSA